MNNDPLIQQLQEEARNLARITERGMWWVRLDETEHIIATAVQKAREEVCENHLHELDDALQDTDTYGAISGMAYALRKIITTPTTPEHV